MRPRLPTVPSGVCKVVVVDRLRAAAGRQPPTIQWLLQLPAEPKQEDQGLVAWNASSWIRCRGLLPAEGRVTVAATPVSTHRVSLAYDGQPELTLVHLLEVGDGTTAGPPVPVAVRQAGRDLVV